PFNLDMESPWFEKDLKCSPNLPGMVSHTTTTQARHGKPPVSLPDRFARSFDVRRERRDTFYFEEFFAGACAAAPPRTQNKTASYQSRRPPSKTSDRKIASATSDSAIGKSRHDSIAFDWHRDRG